jgi:hypothetical protein
MRTRLVAITFSLLAALPLPSAAQSRIAHVALLTGAPTSNLAAVPTWQAFIEVPRQRGWTEGGNLEFHHRWTGGHDARWPQLAAELVALRPDLIIAVGSQATQAAREKTDTIPIVMIGVADPIGSGFVASLARPGGNITAPLPNSDTNEKAFSRSRRRAGDLRIGLFGFRQLGIKAQQGGFVAIAPRRPPSSRSRSTRPRISMRLLRRLRGAGRTPCSLTPARCCPNTAQRSLPLRWTTACPRSARRHCGRAPVC